MRIIDAHNHPDWHCHNLDKYLANMAQYNIDKTWLLSWESPPTEYDPAYNHVSLIGEHGYPIPFSRCLAYKERAPDKFVLRYAPDPRRPMPLTNWMRRLRFTAYRSMARSNCA